MRVKEGDLYVSSVEGHIVPRFGSARNGLKAQAIGVYPVVTMRANAQGEKEPTFDGMRWDTNEVVRVPRDAYIANLKDYDRALADRALKRRTKADFDAYMKEILAEEKKALDAVVAAQKKADEAAKKEALEDEAADKAAAEETKKAAASAAAGKQE